MSIKKRWKKKMRTNIKNKKMFALKNFSNGISAKKYKILKDHLDGWW